MDEAAQIRKRYQDRKKSTGERYSLFNRGNLFILQQRERVLLKLLGKHGKRNFDGYKILEVGCGEGFWLRELMRYGALPANLYGVDLLPERVQRARSLYPNISITQGNCEILDFPGQEFDIVLQSTVFSSILSSDMKKNIAAEMLRVVRRDGIILWYDLRYDNPRNPDVRGIKRREIASLFPGCEIDLRTTTLAPPLSRRLAGSSWPLCEFLSHIRPLCTHHLAVIKPGAGPNPNHQGPK
jgi:ubiquinone/menaquinone biosynthesis C-methylase UbiE